MQSGKRPTVVLVDNSVSVTGALKCAVQQAVLMQAQYRYVFVLPQGSAALAYMQQHHFAVHQINMLELSRNWKKLLHYPLQLWQSARRLRQIIKKEQSAFLVMNDFYNLTGAALKATGHPVKLFTFVRLLPRSVPGVLRRLWVGTALRYAQNLIAVSNAVKKDLPQHPKVCLLYDAVAPAEQHPPYDPPGGTNTIELLYLGNYIRGKGQDHALRAFAVAYGQNKKLRLTFRGGDMGLLKNKVFRQQLEQQAEEWGLMSVVSFLPFEADVERAYKEAHLFLNFSESESFSMTCAEAAYYGVPTIASRCGGPEELMVHNETGWLVPNRDVAAMAEAILTLAKDTSLRQQFSAQSRAFMQRQFGAAPFTAGLGSIFAGGPAA